MRDNDLDQSKVMNEDDKEVEMKSSKKGSDAQFPGDKMPQINHTGKSKKKRVAIQSRYGERR